MFKEKPGNVDRIGSNAVERVSLRGRGLTLPLWTFVPPVNHPIDIVKKEGPLKVSQFSVVKVYSNKYIYHFLYIHIQLGATVVIAQGSEHTEQANTPANHQITKELSILSAQSFLSTKTSCRIHSLLGFQDWQKSRRSLCKRSPRLRARCHDPCWLLILQQLPSTSKTMLGR